MAGDNRSHFAGVSGEHHVAAVLAYKGLHVALVPEGGAGVDLLVSTPDGARGAAVQVKSRGRAGKRRKRDGVLTGYDWFVGKKVFGQDPDLVYALVDLKEWEEGAPDVFVMRAGDLVAHFRGLMEERPEVDWENNAYIFQPKPDQVEPYRNDWGPLLWRLGVGGADGAGRLGGEA